MSGSNDKDDVPARRPVTRSLVQSGLIFFISPASSGPSGPIPIPAKQAKKVKFVEPGENSGGHNSSVATDDGIDLSFSSLSSSINIPPSIARRPLHSLGQTWTFWFSGTNKRVSWTQDLVSIANMRTVEEFWSVHTKVCLTPVCPSVYTVISRSSPAVS